MTKVNFPIRSSARAVGSRHWRWVMAASAAVACGMLWAGTNGAEQVDSGWAIASPSPLATGSKPNDPHQQIILRHVLEQTQQPLLQKPSPTSAAQKTTDNGHSGLRFAARNDGEEGWRPIGQPTSIGGNAIPKAAAKAPEPQFGVRVSVPKAKKDAEAESDCSGETTAAAPKTIHAHEATSPLADAYAKPPVSTPPAADDEETCQGNVSEQPADEEAEEGIAESMAPDAEFEEIEIDTSDASTDEDAASEEAASKATSTPSEEKKNAAATTKAPVVEPAETVPPPPLTKQLTNLRSRVRSVLNGYYRKQLNSRDHDPWEVMHGMLAYGVHSRIRQGSPRGEPITSRRLAVLQQAVQGPNADVRDARGRSAGEVRRRPAGTLGAIARDAGPVPRLGRLSDPRRQERVHDPRPDRGREENLLSQSRS